MITTLLFTILSVLPLGTCVEVIEGPFTGYVGTVYQAQKGKYTVRIRLDEEIYLQLPVESRNITQVEQERCK